MELGEFEAYLQQTTLSAEQVRGIIHSMFLQRDELKLTHQKQCSDYEARLSSLNETIDEMQMQEAELKNQLTLQEESLDQ